MCLLTDDLLLRAKQKRRNNITQVNFFNE